MWAGTVLGNSWVGCVSFPGRSPLAGMTGMLIGWLAPGVPSIVPERRWVSVHLCLTEGLEGVGVIPEGEECLVLMFLEDNLSRPPEIHFVRGSFEVHFVFAVIIWGCHESSMLSGGG